MLTLKLYLKRIIIKKSEMVVEIIFYSRSLNKYKQIIGLNSVDSGAVEPDPR